MTASRPGSNVRFDRMETKSVQSYITWHAISEIHACCDAIDLRPAAAVQPNRGLSEKQTFADWGQRKFVARSMIC